MRSFQDEQGTSWQAALLEASYGHISVVFSPMQGGAIRHHLLDAEHLRQANTLLDAADEDQLRTWLSAASDWTAGSA